MKKEQFWFSKLNYLRMESGFDSISANKITTNRDIPPHKQEDVEIILIVSGKGIASINGIDYPLSKGSFILLYPYHIHTIHTDCEDPLTMYVCTMGFGVQVGIEIDVEVREMIIQMLFDGSPLVQISGIWFNRISDVFATLVEESQSSHPFKFGVMRSLIGTMTMYFYRMSYENLNRNGKHETAFHWEIFKYIYLNNQENITADSTAKHFNITVSEMNHLLRKEFGMDFNVNLHDARIGNACALMQFTELSLLFIARSVGYKTYSTFYRAFRSVKSCTPEEYLSRKATLSKNKKQYGDTAWSIFIFMYENYSSSLTSDTVSKRFHLSRSSLDLMIRSSFNQSFLELLTNIRITYARSFLSASDMLVCDISALVGFKSTRTFDRNFHQITGMSPSEYRYNHKVKFEVESTQSYHDYNGLMISDTKL